MPAPSGCPAPRQIVFHRHGGPDVLAIEPFVPRPLGHREVRVAVARSGINYADVIARHGFYKWAPPFPTCLGFELAGTVTEIGRGVHEHAVGDRVLALTRFGGYAEEVVVEAARAFTIPREKSLDEAAALPAVSLTAWRVLHDVARIRRGDTLLVQAVAGGVGLAAVQIAKAAGAVTFGVASSPSKLALARAFGLDHAIDSSKTDFEEEVRRLTDGRGVDRVLDSLGGEGLRKGYRCLAPGGLVVSIGAAQVAPTTRAPWDLLKAGAELVRGGVYHPFPLIEENRGIAGVQVLLLWDDLALVQRGMREVIAAWSRGTLTPHVDRVFPVSEVAAAHALLESRRSRGKLLLAWS